MAYDRADWHYGGDYPEGLPPENGGTHIGMFLAWAIMNGLEGQFHRDESPTSLAAVRARQMTGRQFLFNRIVLALVLLLDFSVIDYEDEDDDED